MSANFGYFRSSIGVLFFSGINSVLFVIASMNDLSFTLKIFYKYLFTLLKLMLFSKSNGFSIPILLGEAIFNLISIVAT